jgi:radical SAM protein with 4Fe4S-binding SPASM domain
VPKRGDVTLNAAAILPRVPESCYWEITDACNLRCLHCEADAGWASPDELTTSEALDVAVQLAEAGCQKVFLTGGEPLLRQDWPAIAKCFSDLRIAVSIISNGVLVNPSTIAQMLEAGVSGLSVSLDGNREVHDAIRIPAHGSTPSSYDSALRAVELGVKSPLKTAAVSLIHRKNLHQLRALYELMVSLGVAVWQVQICMPLGRMRSRTEEFLVAPSDLVAIEQTLASFIEEGRLQLAVGDNIGYYGRCEPTIRGAVRHTKSFWLGCLAGCRVVGLCSNGDVKGCPSHPRSLGVGNLRQQRFADIWGDASRFAYNTGDVTNQLAASCRACSYHRLCRGGCRSMALGSSGDLFDNRYCLQRVSGGPSLCQQPGAPCAKAI